MNGVGSFQGPMMKVIYSGEVLLLGLTDRFSLTGSMHTCSQGMACEQKMDMDPYRESITFML